MWRFESYSCVCFTDKIESISSKAFCIHPFDWGEKKAVLLVRFSGAHVCCRIRRILLFFPVSLVNDQVILHWCILCAILLAMNKKEAVFEAGFRRVDHKRFDVFRRRILTCKLAIPLRFAFCLFSFQTCKVPFIPLTLPSAFLRVSFIFVTCSILK